MEDDGDNCPTCRHPDGIPPEHLALMRANAARPDVRARFAANMATEGTGFFRQATPVMLPPEQTSAMLRNGPAVVGMLAPGQRPAFNLPTRNENGATFLRLHGPESLPNVGPPQYLRQMHHPAEHIRDPATRAALNEQSLFSQYSGIVPDVAAMLAEADRVKADCEERFRDCQSQARLDLLADRIDDAQYSARIRNCARDRDICLRLVEALQVLALRAPINPMDKLRRARIGAKTHDCILKASQIADPTLRARAIAECQREYSLSVMHAAFIDGWVQDMPGFADIMRRLGPQKRLDCPCCVGSKDEITVHIDGHAVGVTSHTEYITEEHRRQENPFWGPTEFDGYKKNGFKSVEHGGIPGSRHWGFGIEISVPYTPKDCPCTCKFTQFVAAPKDAPFFGGKTIDDVTGWPAIPRTPDDEADRRGRWLLKCKEGRLYFGDYIQRHDEAGDYLFRTIFFSSGTNCTRKWCSIDWSISVRAVVDPLTGVVLAHEFLGFKELGRAEG
jgi:hypothetical protein